MFRPAVLLLTLFASSLALAQEGERAAVLETIQKFFTSIETRDRGLLESILVPGSLNISVRELDNGDASFNVRSYEEVIATLTRPGRPALERSCNETVLIHCFLAFLLSPYDFHIDGEYYHSGVESYQLNKQYNQRLISNSS